MSIKNLEIKPSEAKAVEIASLPTRPTSSATYGGRGLTAQEMKKAYDAYPALIKERFNSLIADLLSGIAINDIPFSIPAHEPFGVNIEQTVKGFLNAVGDILDFGTDNARTIFGFVKQFVNDVAKATSLEYDKSTQLLSLTIDGEKKSVKIDFDEFKNEITILKGRMELAETDIGTLQTDMSVANDEIANLKESKLDKTGGTISGDLEVAGTLFVNGKNYETTVSSLTDRVDFLSTLLFNTIITNTSVEDTYTSRVTAGGLPVVSNTPTTVHRIDGDTVSTESGIKHASFKGVTSVGKNLINQQNILDSTRFAYLQESDLIKRIGTAGANGTAVLETALVPDTYTACVEFIGNAPTYQTSLNVYSNGANIGTIVNSSSIVTNKIYSKSFSSTYPDIQIKYWGAYSDYSFRIWIVRGNSAVPYEKYTTDTSFQLSAARQLRKWDYIDIDNQLIVTGTAEVTRDTAFTDEELATYPAGYILSADRKTIVYPLETPTTAALTVPKTYTAWRNGSETVDTGAADSLPPTITQTYYEEVTSV